jgi:NADPH:quinone reductase
MSSAVARTMRAVVVGSLADAFGGTAVRETPTPYPGPNEALIRIRAAAINFPDLLMTRGAYQFKPDLPFVSGMEFSGEVVAVGEGAAPALIGQAVIGGGKTGAFAEYVAVAATSLRPKPERLSWAQAAAYSATYLTAWVTLVRKGALQRGEWLLVHGASGGVGLACVDLAKHLGARVIAAGSSDIKLAAVAGLHAPDATLNVANGFRERMKELTGGRGADMIVDPVGGDVFDESTRCIAFDGRLMVVGFTSGRIPSIDANMPLIKGYSVIGVRAGEYGRRFPERGAEHIAAIDRLAVEGAITPHVHSELPLEQWRKGFEMLAGRTVVGKVVLVP